MTAKNAIVLIIHRDTIDERETLLALKELVIWVNTGENLKLQVPLAQVDKIIDFICNLCKASLINFA